MRRRRKANQQDFQKNQYKHGRRDYDELEYCSSWVLRRDLQVLAKRMTMGRIFPDWSAREIVRKT